MYLTLARMAITPPGTKHGTQQCSPILVEIPPAKHGAQKSPHNKLLQSEQQPNSPSFQSLLPVMTFTPPVVVDVTCCVTTVVVMVTGWRIWKD